MDIVVFVFLTKVFWGKEGCATRAAHRYALLWCSQKSLGKERVDYAFTCWPLGVAALSSFWQALVNRQGWLTAYKDRKGLDLSWLTSNVCGPRVLKLSTNIWARSLTTFSSITRVFQKIGQSRIYYFRKTTFPRSNQSVLGNLYSYFIQLAISLVSELVRGSPRERCADEGGKCVWKGKRQVSMSRLYIWKTGEPKGEGPC